jgi:hypothetical protein
MYIWVILTHLIGKIHWLKNSIIFASYFKLKKNNIMSETRLDIGKLKKVDLQGKTLEEWCQEKVVEIPDNLKNSYATYVKYFRSEVSGYIVDEKKGVIWEIIKEVSSSTYVDVKNFHINPDGTISYITLYHDGGTYLEEIIENYLKNNNL